MGLDGRELYAIVEPILLMLKEKNKLYGDSYYRLRNEYGKLSFLIRLTDKFNRLKAINSQKLENEDADEDTIVDIVGYCLLELYYRRMKKKLEEVRNVAS